LLLLIIRVAQLLYICDLFFVRILLCDPEEVLVELHELFEDSPFPLVLLVVLGHLDDGVDHPHYEGGVIPICRKLYHAILVFVATIVISQFEIFADLDVVAVDEVVLLIVDAVDFVDDVAHAERTSRWCGHRVVVGQILKGLSEDCVQFGDEDSPFSLLDSSVIGLGVVVESTDGALVGGVQIEGDVLHRVLLGLPHLEFFVVEVPEGNGDDVAGGLRQEFLELLLEGLAQLTLQEWLLLLPATALC
jgi:hypothetical protein